MLRIRPLFSRDVLLFTSLKTPPQTHQLAILSFIRFTFEETDNLFLLCQMRNYKKREEYGEKGKGYYHFCTDGLKTGKLFYTPAQFAFGMILIGLLTIKYDLKVYAFVLMPNHIHIILSGTGENCVKAFDYLRKKISARLREDGYYPLPDEYDFVLLDIKDQNQMRGEIAYVLRNPLEKNYSTPEGYKWGSGWIYHSSIKDAVSGKKVDEMSGREVWRVTSTRDNLPGNWIFNPDLGLLPGSFVDTALVYKLFPTAKDLEVAMVKDYESYVRIAKTLNDEIEYSKQELKGIVEQVLQSHFDGQSLDEMTLDSKYRLAAILSGKYNLTSLQISQSIILKETIVRQVLNSKDYRYYK